MSGNGVVEPQQIWPVDGDLVLVVNRAKLKAFVDSLARDWLGEQQEFYDFLAKSVEDPKE